MSHPAKGTDRVLELGMRRKIVRTRGRPGKEFQVFTPPIEKAAPSTLLMEPTIAAGRQVLSDRYRKRTRTRMTRILMA